MTRTITRQHLKAYKSHRALSPAYWLVADHEIGAVSAVSVLPQKTEMKTAKDLLNI